MIQAVRDKVLVLLAYVVTLPAHRAVCNVFCLLAFNNKTSHNPEHLLRAFYMSERRFLMIIRAPCIRTTLRHTYIEGTDYHE